MLKDVAYVVDIVLSSFWPQRPVNMRSLSQTITHYSQLLTRYAENGSSLDQEQSLRVLEGIASVLYEPLRDWVRQLRTLDKKSEAPALVEKSEFQTFRELPTFDSDFKIDQEYVRIALENGLVAEWADQILDVLIPAGFMGRDHLQQVTGVDPASLSRLLHYMVDKKLIEPWLQKRRGARPLQVFRASRIQVTGPDVVYPSVNEPPVKNPQTDVEWCYWLRWHIIDKKESYEIKNKTTFECEEGWQLGPTSFKRLLYEQKLAPPPQSLDFGSTTNPTVAHFGLKIEEVTEAKTGNSGPYFRAIAHKWKSERLRTEHRWGTEPPKVASEWAQWIRYCIEDAKKPLNLEQLGRDAAIKWPAAVDAMDKADRRGDIIDLRRRCGQNAWRWAILWIEDGDGRPMAEIDFKHCQRCW